MLGLEADHREALAKGMVDNFLFEIEHYGAVLNANRTYYLTRSQPPFLTSMIRAVYENPASFAGNAGGPHRGAMRGWSMRTRWRRRTTRRGRGRSTKAGDDGTGALLRLRHGTGAGDGRRQHLLSRRDSLAGGASQAEAGEGFLVKGLGASRCGGGSAAEADELRCEGQRGVHARVGRRIPAEQGFLRGRSRDAGVGIRSELSLRAVRRSDASLCAGVPEQPALSLRARPGAHCASAGEAAGCGALGQRAKPRNAAMQRYLWRPQGRRVCGLRLRARTSVGLRVHHVALSAVGGRGDARRGEADGGEAELV